MPAVGRGTRGPPAGECRGPPVARGGAGRVEALCQGSKGLWGSAGYLSCSLPGNAVESPLRVLMSASEGIKKCCLFGWFLPG